MNVKNYGKPLFAIFVAAMIISVAWLSYFYIGGGQEAFTGDVDDANDAPTDEEDTTPITSNLAPDFTYTAVNGGTVSLSSLRGKVVVLDFMATWCVPCKDQIINLKQIDADYGQDVVIISLDVDNSETAAQLLEFRSDLGASWNFALDSNEVSRLSVYDASSIPTMVFINRDGAISSRDVGVMSVSELKAAIDPLL